MSAEGFALPRFYLVALKGGSKFRLSHDDFVGDSIYVERRLVNFYAFLDRIGGSYTRAIHVFL